MAASKDSTPSFIATIRLKTDRKAEKQLLVLSDWENNFTMRV
ncbi:hypothetical protein V7087_08600 [Neobacillus niacini]